MGGARSAWLLLLWVSSCRPEALPSEPGPVAAVAGLEGGGSVDHYAYLDMPSQKSDGLGGHVLRALPPLDFALALGLRIVCNPDVFFNGKSDDPVLFSTLVGCVDRTNPNITKEQLRWAELTDWVDADAVSSLPHVRVKLCKLPQTLGKLRSDGASSTVLVLSVAESQEDMGANTGPWLRKQFHTVRQERQRASAPRAPGDEGAADALAVDGEAVWGDTPRGRRVLVHYRTGMWSLMPIHKHGPPHFATYFEVVEHILRKLEGDGAISPEGSEGARLVLMAIWIEDQQAIERTEYELDLFAQRYPRAAVKLFSERSHAKRSDRLIRDLDVLTTSDYLLTSVSQWGTVVKMLQVGSGVHIGLRGHVRLRLNNSIVINPDGSLPSRAEARAAAWRPLGPADLAGYCRDNPKLQKRENGITGKGRGGPAPTPSKQFDDFKRQQLRRIADREYRGPKLPKERQGPVAWEVRLGSDPWPAEPLCKTCSYAGEEAEGQAATSRPAELTSDEIDEDADDDGAAETAAALEGGSRSEL